MIERTFGFFRNGNDFIPRLLVSDDNAHLRPVRLPDQRGNELGHVKSMRESNRRVAGPRNRRHVIRHVNSEGEGEGAEVALRLGQPVVVQEEPVGDRCVLQTRRGAELSPSSQLGFGRWERRCMPARI